MEENTQDVALENNETAEDALILDTVEETVDWKKIAEQNAAEAAKFKAIADRQKRKQTSLTSSNHKELDDETVQTVKRLAQAEEKRQFGYEHGLSPEETDAVFKFSNEKPTKETLEHPFVKAGIESLRAAKRTDANTPSPSSRSLTFQGKAFTELKPEERQKAFEDRMKGVKK